jgi:hypothetical protein
MKIRLLPALAVLTGISLLPVSIVWADQSAPVEKTIQTTSYATSDGSDHQVGIATPNPRFIDNGDGTVTDNLNNLIWLRNANCFGAQTLDNATLDAAGLKSGECGLADDSVEGDWRLPTFKELSGLKADSQTRNPNYLSGSWTIPGAPFLSVQSHYYWSTTNCSLTGQAWFSAVGFDSTCASATCDDQYVWPVRQPIDAGGMIF